MTTDSISTTARANDVVRRLWQFCNVLRDDGLSYPDYVEQLTYLLFLKMSAEDSASRIPKGYGWASFAKLDPDEMHEKYSSSLARLSQEKGLLGLIFKNAKNRIRDPGKLKLLVSGLIGPLQWSDLPGDVKGDAYEGLLEKNARDTKSGAGQYFTPRPLVDAIVSCIDPRQGESICDPACGTGGFLLAAHRHLESVGSGSSTKAAEFLGVELVEEVARLAAMNLYLHGMTNGPRGRLPILRADSLETPPTRKVDVVLTNPPFGVKGSVTYVGEGGKQTRSSNDLTVLRPDFWAATSNKQLNFVQHVISLLKIGGRAALVLPDNVLYEGGAAKAVRRHLLESYDVHTLVRLPPGLFYAQGVLANIMFVNKRPASSSPAVWVYDLRTDRRFSMKTRPLMPEDLTDFVTRFKGTSRDVVKLEQQSDQWRAFPKDLLRAGEWNLDLAWKRQDALISEAGSRLDNLTAGVFRDLESAMEQLRKLSRKG